MKKTFRGFIAIEIPNTLIDRIRPAMDELGKAGEDVKPVEGENLHITLKFLGDTRYEDLAKIEDALREIAKQTKKSTVSLRGVGVFPNENYIRVVWIGCESKGNELKGLADRINEGLGKIGFPMEENTPHLTIARVRRKIDLRDFLTKHKNSEFGEFEVSRFFLKQSILGRGGGNCPKYETIVEVALD